MLMKLDLREKGNVKGLQIFLQNRLCQIRNPGFI
jgi:hypothetical protein